MYNIHIAITEMLPRALSIGWGSANGIYDNVWEKNKSKEINNKIPMVNELRDFRDGLASKSRKILLTKIQ